MFENILYIFWNILNMKAKQNFKHLFNELNWMKIVYPNCKFCQFYSPSFNLKSICLSCFRRKIIIIFCILFYLVQYIIYRKLQHIFSSLVKLIFFFPPSNWNHIFYLICIIPFFNVCAKTASMCVTKQCCQPAQCVLDEFPSQCLLIIL